MNSNLRELVHHLLDGWVDLDHPMYAVLLDEAGDPVTTAHPVRFEAIDNGGRQILMCLVEGATFEIDSYEVIHGIGFYIENAPDASMVFYSQFNNPITVMAGDAVQCGAGSVNISVDNRADLLCLSDFYPNRDNPEQARTEQARTEHVITSTTRRVRISTHGKTQDKTPSKTEVRTRRVRTVGRRQNPGRG